MINNCDKSIDRKSRDKLAETMAKFMRGEIKSDEFDDIRSLEVSNEDKSACIIKETLWGYYSDWSDHHVSLSFEAWEQMRRWVAFLKTDYKLKTHKFNLNSYSLFIALLFVILFGAGLVFSWHYATWSVLASLWIILGVAWSFIRKSVQRKSHHMELEDKKYNNLCKYSPFLSEEDWHQHEQLITPLLIPKYDTELHKKRLHNLKSHESTKNERRLDEFFLCICYLVIFPFELIWRLDHPVTQIKVYLRADN